MYFYAFHAKISRSQIPIKTDDDGQFTKSGYYWSNPPAETDYYFYLFHILNPDNVTFLGHTPIVQEKGPYRWKEQDKKVSINFIANKSKVSYETTKTYVFSKEGSCPECEYDDFIELPNLSIAVSLLLCLCENRWTLKCSMYT